MWCPRLPSKTISKFIGSDIHSSSRDRTVRLSLFHAFFDLPRHALQIYIVTNERGVQVRASLKWHCATAMAVVKISKIASASIVATARTRPVVSVVGGPAREWSRLGRGRRGARA